MCTDCNTIRKKDKEKEPPKYGIWKIVWKNKQMELVWVAKAACVHVPLKMEERVTI